MPKISVIMSVYNEREAHLLDAINSILNQTFKDFEFIIIDDGSEKSVHTVITTIIDDRIKLITNEENIGLTASLNKGLFWSSGEYIARQDSDDVSERSRLHQQASYLDRHLEIGVLGTSTTIINELGDKIDEWDADPNPMESLKTGNRLTHGSVMFRRSIMDDIGKYDYHFKYAQDYEYWLRISKKYQIRNLPNRLYQSRFHDGMLSVTKIKEQARFVIRAQRMSGLRGDYPDDLQMTKNEQIRYLNMLAYSYVQANKMKEAEETFWALLKINPLNIVNLMRIITNYTNGRDGIISIQNTYRKLRAHKK